MLRFSKEQRKLLAENVSNVANVGAGAWVFGPFLSGQRYSLVQLALGTVFWAVCVALSLLLIKERSL